MLLNGLSISEKLCTVLNFVLSLTLVKCPFSIAVLKLLLGSLSIYKLAFLIPVKLCPPLAFISVFPNGIMIAGTQEEVKPRSYL